MRETSTTSHVSKKCQRFSLANSMIFLFSQNLKPKAIIDICSQKLQATAGVGRLLG
jgi:hypothetical protein